jgi:puromycin-sensitive aminopeptidase
MASASKTGGTGAPDEPFRLPRTVTPHHYRLTLDVDLEEARFTGSAEIEVDIEVELDEIVLNAAELEIDGATLELGSETIAASVGLDAEAERATFALERSAPTGPGVLRCRFAGVLNDRLRGFYRSTFVDSDGSKRTIATTQMESTDARRAFPCWDEPDRKAIFEITLVVDEALAAYSNSPIAAETGAGGGRKAVRFAPTMVMSSYLVALIVGPLEATEPRDVDGVPVRVVHVPGKAHLSGFALEVADHALRFFSSYFAIAYPAEKLDLVAIPDFAFGAMENLGCVTFRETALLVDAKAAARSDLERVADVIAHEIAHMWFGDLVTMRWWEGI